MKRDRIINYLILLQIFQYKRDKLRSFYEKYKDLFDESIEELLFEADNKDLLHTLFLTNEMVENAKNCYKLYENNILFYEDDDFPLSLKKVEKYPILLFYNGNKKLLNRISISVVGTRNPSDEGVFNTRRIANFLMNNNLVVVSGLAKGVDINAHKFCLNNNYFDLIGVIGTPLCKFYPKEHEKYQKLIADKGLIISEFPNFEPTFKWNFIRRNYIMSAISDATIVIEASDTSGTISQARSTLKNKKNLYVPGKVFENPNNSWPSKFKEEYQNVYKFRYLEELKDLLTDYFKSIK